MSVNRLTVLQEEVKSCTKCELHATRNNTVFARGNPLSYITICGESPGEEEDKTGLPFVGKSGQLLDKTLTELGLNVQTDIYVCNIIKCRPPGNRRPTEEETNHCIDYLEEQLKLVNPKVIVALGNTAISNLIATTYGITKIHGQFFRRGTTLVMPVYHPSFVIRNGSSGQVYEDFKADLQAAINKIKELSDDGN